MAAREREMTKKGDNRYRINSKKHYLPPHNK
jgi:hypothetical protein